MKKIILGGLIISAFVVLAGCSSSLTADQAKEKVETFINQNLVTEGETVTISDISEEDGLYKLEVVFTSGQQTASYMTKDGKKFFPSFYDIAGEDNSAVDAPENENEVVVADVIKADKPQVELFVMSHCPFGTQIEKGILPVLETLGDEIDFELKFCDYAMHGKEELDEQLNQYCIQRDEPDKFTDYLTCFLEAGDGAKCLQDIGINMLGLSQCTKAIDKEFQVSQAFEDQGTWVSGRYPQFNIYKEDNTRYGVQGSPTLVINGAQVASGRSSQALLANICAGFNTPPEACNTELASAAPAPGFGFSGTGSDSNALCE